MPAHAAQSIPWEDEDYCTGKFDPITYDPEDIGETRVYEIAEQPCHEAGTSTLCGTSCTLKVTIINDDGQIRAESEYKNGEHPTSIWTDYAKFVSAVVPSEHPKTQKTEEPESEPEETQGQDEGKTTTPAQRTTTRRMTIGSPRLRTSLSHGACAT